MMCDSCGKNPATTHLKRIVNGTVYEKNLCAYCAAKEGYGGLGNLSLSNMLASMLDSSMTSSLKESKRCSCCKASFSDIAESGRVGCSQCYDTFRDELEPSLNRLHGKALHIGKRPENEDKSAKTEDKPVTREDKIKALREEMARLVALEDFENAAKCRDEIKKLEEKGEDNE